MRMSNLDSAIAATRAGVEIRDEHGNLANRPVKTIRMDATRIDKGGHEHFMAKEIAEQPDASSFGSGFEMPSEHCRAKLADSVVTGYGS